MQREIKFRAWVIDSYDDNDKPIWKMIDGDSLAFEEFAPLCHLLQDKPGEAHYMQYIGLKDKNGKEIYEGDIIVIWTKPKKGYDYYFKIVFKDGAFMLEGEDLKPFGLQPFASLYQKDSEVIGNIYENPELLNS